jgi:Trypsin-like peptidase domain
MNARLLALAFALAGGADAAVILRSPEEALKAVADKLHSTVIEVSGRVSVRADGGSVLPERVTHGTGTLLGQGFAVTTLHAVALPSPAGKLIPLQDVQVTVAGGEPMAAQVIVGAPDLDLAILALPAEAAALEAPPLSTDTPAEGDPLVAMGVDDDAVVVVGVSLAAVNGEILSVGGKRMLDSRFWGGPLYDGRGRLVAIELMSLGPPKAISAQVIQRMLDQRPAMGSLIGAVPAEQHAP